MECACGAHAKREYQRYTTIEDAEKASGKSVGKVPCVVITDDCPSCRRHSTSISYPPEAKAPGLLSLLNASRQVKIETHVKPLKAKTMIETIHSTIMTLRGISGANAKKESLTAALALHPCLSNFLRLVYNPQMSFYQTELQLNSVPRMLLGKIEPTDTLADVYVVLSKMNEKLLLGKAGAQALAREAHRLSREGQELVQIILNRDIKAGLAEKSINECYKKAYGTNTKLIPTMAYQRYDNMTIEKLKAVDFANGVFSQIKSDGMFGNIVNHENNTYLLSRAGSPLEGESVLPLLDYVDELFDDCCMEENVVHGEILVWDTVDKVILPRAVGNGMLNSVIQTGSTLDKRYVLRFRAWDIIPYENWIEGKELTQPYEHRFNIIDQMFGDDETDIITVQECRVVRSYREAVAHFKDALARKEEGTIIKPFSMGWIDGDSSEGMKLKMDMECELIIVGFNDGDAKGKHKHTFGSLQCESSDGLLSVGVSGMSDALRKWIHEHRDECVGCAITVRSNGVQDKEDSDLKSLFLPRLVSEVRLDKKTADSLPKIYEIQESVIENIQKQLMAA
ncbi:DNA ligase [Serratia phage phiMAM1]|uniref:DNA ligase n=1 Tax=Serratia phage phiMAM1 TaxID=1262513 RepID=K7YBA3_9CAUD|nr:DNA ligase [Serratia phage phiMAM1]AFX93632.1 DNA ligase [Serratia phage phiMAM1]